MTSARKFFTRFLLILFAFAPNGLAQQPSPKSAAQTVEVKASMTEAEVGQQVKLNVVAKDASGKVVNAQPSTYFAGPFDAATAGDDGIVKLHGPGEVIAGAVFEGAPGKQGPSGFTTIIVRPAGIKTVCSITSKLHW